ncbi:T-cell surface glycoprotein CD5 isoform X1 [Mustela nigripes]|uniref:T-cell surface glycoprotein CD5 n=2 Tax=Mustela putorius furo TaxID=9669 RepID=M3YSG1_MUSPF|nr:T-cell surface glycoprotein CD5 isoform X1 [Mustela putorius furo]XP_058999683.1 T-cell surface glycoprotein CD5 isoform X1 [Mustela lutreola]XP_059260637.1 T-cell surface glycoprotein CD5 isoform X1 [Mustela nigripes]
MGFQQPSLAALYLLGVLVTSCLGGPYRENSGNMVRLTGSNSPCQGQLEVLLGSTWHTVSRWSWNQGTNHREDNTQASEFCRSLACGKALILAHFPDFNNPQHPVTCYGRLGSFSNCSYSEARQRSSLGLICQEPPKTPPPPTSLPPTTTPEPTAPPRLQLVAGPGGLRCAGVVEFYYGSLGGAISYHKQDQDRTQDLKNRICAALHCGSFLRHLPEAETTRTQDPGESKALPIRWEIQNASCASLEQCFRKVPPYEGGQALALVCSDFQPKVQSRLVGGSSLCEGSVQVRQGKQWEALCDVSWAKGTARWEEVCQEQQCGKVNSYRVLDAAEKTSHGLSCPQEKLSQCHQLQEKKTRCKRVFVTCQDPNPAGLGAGTVMSIVLALVLLAVLLVVCGPHAYRKLVKKFRQKKQRQWIGPTGMNQNMSFHRNHTATVRSQAENTTVSHVENEYSQPPRNSQVSAYAALEGALRRVSTQPDNSSDSDYDLHGTQRL